MKTAEETVIKVIMFRKTQPDSMLDCFDDSLRGWHIIMPPTDYTACGHATDEYNIIEKEGKVTCKECLRVIKFFKKVIRQQRRMMYKKIEGELVKK